MQIVYITSNTVGADAMDPELHLCIGDPRTTLFSSEAMLSRSSPLSEQRFITPMLNKRLLKCARGKLCAVDVYPELHEGCAGVAMGLMQYDNSLRPMTLNI